MYQFVGSFPALPSFIARNVHAPLFFRSSAGRVVSAARPAPFCSYFRRQQRSPSTADCRADCSAASFFLEHPNFFDGFEVASSKVFIFP